MIGTSDLDAAGARRRTAFGKYLGAAAASIALLVGAAIPAAAAELMTVTFVRHAQSAGNASGLIDTSVPGPHITELGQEQARAVVGTLGNNNYDSIYASTMIRTERMSPPSGVAAAESRCTVSDSVRRAANPPAHSMRGPRPGRATSRTSERMSTRRRKPVPEAARAPTAGRAWRPGRRSAR